VSAALASTFSIGAPNARRNVNQALPRGIAGRTKFRFVCSDGNSLFDWETRVNSELFRRAVTCALMKPALRGEERWGARARATFAVICDRARSIFGSSVVRIDRRRSNGGIFRGARVLIDLGEMG